MFEYIPIEFYFILYTGTVDYNCLDNNGKKWNLQGALLTILCEYLFLKFY